MSEGTGFQIEKLSELIGEAIVARSTWKNLKDIGQMPPIGGSTIPVLPEDNSVLQYVMNHCETLLGILRITTQGQAEKETTLEESATAIDNIHLHWIVDYIIKSRLRENHLKALKTIISMFNESEESEREIFEFAGHLTARYGGKA